MERKVLKRKTNKKEAVSTEKSLEAVRCGGVC